jgi:flagellar biogenesis protein FliO
MLWATLKMVLALGVVIALLVFLVRLFKRWQRVQGILGPDNGIRVLTTKLIAPQKYVSLVEIGGEVLALGVTPQQITFLTKVENKEMIQKSLTRPGFKPEAIPWLKSLALFSRKERGEMAEMGNER